MAQSLRPISWTFTADPEPALSFKADAGEGADIGRDATLHGHWAFGLFLAELDGLSARQLEAALGDTAGDDIALTLTLRTGLSVRFLGGRVEPGLSHGLAIPLPSSARARPRAGSHRKAAPHLEPVFQPVVRLATGAVAGFEALARWTDGHGAMFGPEAHEGQELLTPELGLKMVNESARMLQSALKAEPAQAPRSLFVTVNLSAIDLDDAAVVHAIGAAIQQHGLPPRSLRVELTEQAAMRNATRTQAAIAAIRAAGAGVLLDDFVGGHSSLLWLADAVVDGIKLDARVSALALRRRGQGIIKALVGLSTQLGIGVTAEGIETPELAAALHQLGVRFGQGFLFAAGLPRDQALRLVQGHEPEGVGPRDDVREGVPDRPAG